MNHEILIQQFCEYVCIDTQAVLPVPGQERRYPSSVGQDKLANHVRSQCNGIGIVDHTTVVTDGSFVVTVNASKGCYNAPHICLAVHLDTHYSLSGAARPIVHTGYQGGGITLPHNGVIISADDLQPYIGQTIITANGTSLLGADCKAGITAVMTALRRIDAEGIAHGPVSVWFCTDEEIGLDPSFIPEDLVRQWEYLITVDGMELGPIDVETCCTGQYTVTFKGKSAHPGLAGKDIQPAHYAAIDFAYQVNQQSSPMNTEPTESCWHVIDITGDADNATVLCAPRIFERAVFDNVESLMQQWAAAAADKYKVSASVDGRVVCLNVADPINEHPELLSVLMQAHQQAGCQPVQRSLRAGTQGAMITPRFPHLPAPNIGNGSHNPHSLREFAVVEEMIRAADVLVHAIYGYAMMKR